MKKKTIPVETVKNLVNEFLANPATTPEEREAQCSLLESVLFTTGNYAGYRYLETTEIEGNGSRRQYF